MTVEPKKLTVYKNHDFFLLLFYTFDVSYILHISIVFRFRGVFLNDLLFVKDKRA